MDINKHKRVRLRRRHNRVRKTISGTAERPRLAVFRSLNHIYAQVIDDLSGKTIASASSREGGLGLERCGNVSAASAVGKAVAERAKEKGVKTVAFDRGGFRYHGRIRALADAARSEGLEF